MGASGSSPRVDEEPKVYGGGNGRSAKKYTRAAVDRKSLKEGDVFHSDMSENMAHTLKPKVVKQVLSKLTHVPATKPVSLQPLPNEWDRKKAAWTMEQVFSPDECRQLIDLTESLGYEPALINIGGGLQQYLPDSRNNDRVMIDTHEIAGVLFDRLKEHLPQEYDGKRLHCLNERLRFLRYDPGMEFKTHSDGTYVSKTKEVSYVTVIVYLNDEYKGGHTEFVKGTWCAVLGNGKIYDQPPGKALVFKHNIYHCGMPLTKGRKYILRTDVMYKTPGRYDEHGKWTLEPEPAKPPKAEAKEV